MLIGSKIYYRISAFTNDIKFVKWSGEMNEVTVKYNNGQLYIGRKLRSIERRFCSQFHPLLRPHINTPKLIKMLAGTQKLAGNYKIIHHTFVTSHEGSCNYNFFPYKYVILFEQYTYIRLCDCARNVPTLYLSILACFRMYSNKKVFILQ